MVSRVLDRILWADFCYVSTYKEKGAEAPVFVADLLLSFPYYKDRLFGLSGDSMQTIHFVFYPTPPKDLQITLLHFFILSDYLLV